MSTKYRAPLIPQLKDYSQIASMFADSNPSTVSGSLGQINMSDPSYDFSFTEPLDYNGPIATTPGAVTPVSVNFMQDPQGYVYRQANLVRDYFGNKVDNYTNQTKQWMDNNIKPGIDSTKLAWDKMDLSQRIGTVGGVIKDLYGLYNANQQLGVAKDTLNFNKQTWNQRWDAQAKATNAQLSDRQARRVQSATINGDPNSVTSVSDYMKKYGV